jgi:hypothetical protein
MDMGLSLAIVAHGTENVGRQYRQYELDGIPTIGVMQGEEFGIRFNSRFFDTIQVVVSVDGTNVLTGKQATLDPLQRMWVVQGYGSLELIAWPETTESGAAFVFTSAAKSVAAHTHGDMSARGYIGVAVFVEGSEQLYWPRSMPRGSMYMGVEKGGLESSDSSPGVGAGAQKSQQIGTAQGLIKPKFEKLLQIRYMWWDEMLEKLLQTSPDRTGSHPTGFKPGKLADLGTTPRLEASPSTPYEFTRFE